MTSLLHPDGMPSYRIDRSYEWNYGNAPDDAAAQSAVVPATIPGTFLGAPVASCLGIAAGPLLNSRWLLYYARLGFDILTYKTVRRCARECYPLPNLVPVREVMLTEGGKSVTADTAMHSSWAISFGMPSRSPNAWMEDVARARKGLGNGQKLVVSVTATPEPHHTLDDVAGDFAETAAMAVQSGADAVEANLSSPNVSTSEASLYLDPPSAGIVCQAIRKAVGAAKLAIKIGHLNDEEHAERLVESTAEWIDGIAMTNCISARVHDSAGRSLFNDEPRGVGGSAILSASVKQVAMFRRVIDRRNAAIRLIGVGGIQNAADVGQYLDAGAEWVGLATAVMVDPLVGVRIRSEWANRDQR